MATSKKRKKQNIDSEDYLINENNTTTESSRAKRARFTTRLLLILLLLSFLLTIIPTKVFGEMTPRSTLEEYVDSSFRNLKVPGGALILMDKDKVESFYYGENSLGLIDENSQFLIGSFSDSITSIGILKLVDEGKLSLDSKIIDLLPDFANSNPYTSDITVKELLSHTSGISKEDGYKITNLGLSGNDSIKAAMSKISKLKVGKKDFNESNLNYLILGRVIEVVSTKPFNVYIKENIFKPLEMNSTYALKEDAAKNKMDKGYSSFLGIIYKSKQIYDDSGAPYAYISSTPKDLTKYISYLIKDTGAPILKNETKKLLFDAIYKKDYRNNYGFGFRLINPGTTEVEGVSNGLVSDYNSQFSIMPKKHQAIAIMVNKGHALETSKLEELKENLKKAFTNGNLIKINSHLPIIELISFLIPLILFINLLFKHIKIRDPYVFTIADSILAILKILLGIAIIPLIQLLLGYPYKILGSLAPDINFSIIATSILLILHGLSTYYKKYILDKGIKPPFSRQLDFLYNILEKRKITKKKKKETKKGVFHNEKSMRENGRIKLTPLLVFAKVAKKTGKNFTKFVAKRKIASEENYYYDDEMYNLDYTEDIIDVPKESITLGDTINDSNINNPSSVSNLNPTSIINKTTINTEQEEIELLNNETLIQKDAPKEEFYTPNNIVQENDSKIFSYDESINLNEKNKLGEDNNIYLKEFGEEIEDDPISIDEYVYDESLIKNENDSKDSIDIVLNEYMDTSNNDSFNNETNEIINDKENESLNPLSKNSGNETDDSLEEPLKFKTMFLDEDSYSLASEEDIDLENYYYKGQDLVKNDVEIENEDEKKLTDKEIIEILKAKLSKYEDQ